MFKAEDECLTIELGIINLMPFPEIYQADLKKFFTNLPLNINFTWIKLKQKKYSSATTQLDDYKYWTDIRFNNLDAIIVTGAPVEKLSFDEIEYWPELAYLLKYLIEQNKALLGICWGSIAIAQSLGITKKQHDKKIFGIYNVENSTKEMSFSHDCPFSTYATFDEKALAELIEQRFIFPINSHPEIGATTVATSNQQITLCLGHPEYSYARLAEEWDRDSNLKLENISTPVGLNKIDGGKTYWQTDSIEFFTNWLDSVKSFNEQYP